MCSVSLTAVLYINLYSILFSNSAYNINNNNDTPSYSLVSTQNLILCHSFLGFTNLIIVILTIFLSLMV